MISNIGSQMQVAAISWQIYLLTRSALSLGLIGLFRFLPILILAPLAGIIADVYDRRKITLVTQVVMTICAIVLTVATWTKTISPILIYLIVAINAIAVSFEVPSRQSLAPLLLPRNYFMNASSLINLMWRVSGVLGPSIAGFIIAYINIGTVYLINAISFLAAIYSLLIIIPKKQDYIPIVTLDFKSMVKGIKEGFSFVFKTPVISSSMMIDFIATFFASATNLLPIFAKDILKVGSKGFGLLYAAPSLGGVLGGLVFSLLHKAKYQGRLFLIVVWFYGLATLFFGLSKIFYLSFIFLAVAGFTDVVSSTIRNTIRHMKTPDNLRGRMVSVNMLFFYGGPELGEVEAGALAALIGAPASVVVGGIGTMITTSAIAYLSPHLRNYQE